MTETLQVKSQLSPIGTRVFAGIELALIHARCLAGQRKHLPIIPIRLIKHW